MSGNDSAAPRIADQHDEQMIKIKLFSAVISLFLGISCVFSLYPHRAFAQYTLTYQYYMESGHKALAAQQFQEALDYFESAQLVQPSADEPRRYINAIKHSLEGRTRSVPTDRPIRQRREARPQRRKPKAESLQKPMFTEASPYPVRRDPVVKAPVLPEVSISSAPRDAVAQDDIEQLTRDVIQMKVGVAASELSESTEKDAREDLPSVMRSAALQTETGAFTPPVPVVSGETPETIFLDDELWATQPKTNLRLTLKSTVIFEGENIDRFLVITPGFLDVAKIDDGRLRLTAVQRGTTFLHLWDDRGRWTFNVEIVLPVRPRAMRPSQRQPVEHANPFWFHYSADWNSFYTGDSFDALYRDDLGLIQNIGMEGETPYGRIDSSVTYNKFNESTEATEYTAGLAEGHIGSFKDFNLRWFDTQAGFSPLTLPRQYYRGFFAQSKAFHRKIDYQYVRGRNRTIFSSLSPGIVEEKNSFIEGARLTLFPDEENQWSVNYARGYGEARASNLQDQVFSLEGRHRFRNWLVSGETAHEENSSANTFVTLYKGENYSLGVNVRLIQKDFTTITSLPSGRGETGGNVVWTLHRPRVNVRTNLDFYRNSFISNPEDPDALNKDLSAAVDWDLGKTIRLYQSVYYIDTPGELSSRRNVRADTRLTQSFSLTPDKRLSTFIGAAYQRSRFPLSPESEYDRYSVSTGFSVPLAKYLNYYVNKELSLVLDGPTSRVFKPHALNTGVTYNRRFLDSWNGSASLSYRDEERTEGNNSFLAGEDSLIGSLGLSYKPSRDFEWFLDGRVRNIWAESADRDAASEIDIRGGVRMSWDTPFVWSPRGTVSGTVFKDANDNKKRDFDEPGIEGVMVRVGHKETRTDAAGDYKVTIRAKSVEVAADLGSMPKGYVFSTPSVVRVPIGMFRKERVDFGLNTQSGIYGIVFKDSNGNGRPDPNEQFMPRVQVVLDGKTTEVTDTEGTYTFSPVQPGRHSVEIRVNTLPPGMLPLVKIREEVVVAEGTTYVYHIPLK